MGLTAAKSPSGGHVPLGATASRPPGGGHVPPGAKRLKLTKSATTAWRDNLHRQADAVPGATVRVAAAWRSLSNRQALYQYISTPLEFPVTSVHGSLLLAPNKILTVTLPLSNKTSQGPMLPSPNYKTHTKTSVSITPRYPIILALVHPIHHLSHSIPSTPIPMSPNFNQMHSFSRTKLLLTLNTRSITISPPSALSPTSPGGAKLAARRCISSGSSQNFQHT
ncbi:hypothetical protein DEO72_LG7g821 [Vigna unguiculata]|uniref:Uncharacterized protein n=1 Tax=Vigna unguiculata TaxID=3917 RepID=A0A4D6MH04_VIGUN|nr:hypothetical protein DEO72_LG7g821 [Vigna unguiculata]